ncbi:MAG: VanZ family protein [Thermosipho sp. (in: Bacteria)]|nr:VanZ family protein [Thermosipho sp. (in: thermotogales)]
MDKGKSFKALIIFLLIVAWIILIFYFSSRSPVVSSQQSGFVVKILKEIDSAIDFSNTALFRKVELYLKKLWFKTQYVPAEMLVRKTAHFGLYFILGFLSFIGFYKILKNLFISSIVGITFPNLIAVIDEYTQQYYNRGSSLNDVIIDLSGIISGVLFGMILVILYRIIFIIFERKNIKEKESGDG